MKKFQYNVADRLMRYVQIDTTADPNSTSNPSSEKQKDLSKLLYEELTVLGLKNIETDEFGYVYATIPSNTSKKVPVLCFCSHVDTSPDCSGTNVKPILHKNWNGEDIIFPDDHSVVLSSKRHPYLLKKIGDDLITASGLTLLGADDKAGVAIIMNLAELLMNHPEIIHGDIRVLFTPDEEIGQGVDKIDMKKLNADFGYTLDGGELGHLEGETFSANGCKVIFHGISAHPGYAKNKMVSAIKVASYFTSLLPNETLCPEKTDKYEGFVHPVSIEGGVEKTTVGFIVRDFETSKLKEHENLLNNLAQKAIEKFEGATFEMMVTEQYRNMKEILDQFPQVMANAEEAYKRAGLETVTTNIRGGTDGSRLSFMGLPCPNIFTGEMAIHSKQEYVSVQDMEKAVDVLIELVQVWEQKA